MADNKIGKDTCYNMADNKANRALHTYTELLVTWTYTHILIHSSHFLLTWLRIKQMGTKA